MFRTELRAFIAIAVFFTAVPPALAQFCPEHFAQLQSESLGAFWTSPVSPYSEGEERTLSEISMQSEKWRSLQLNNPKQKIESYTTIFLENVTTATRNVFARDFENGKVAENLKETLREEHALLTNGEKGRYTGFFDGSPGKNDKGSMEVLSGKFRTPESISNRLALDIDRLLTIPRSSWTNREQILRDIKADPTIEIPGIPEEGLPKNNIAKNFPSERMHIYPGAKYIPAYLDRMQELMKKIRGCESCSRHELVSYIADYYHTGVNAHLFLRANQSLLMSQINYMLLRIGLSGVPPLRVGGQKLDTMALLMGSERFKKYFIEEVLEHSPGK